MEVLKQLVRHVVNTSYDHLPNVVVKEAKRHILDYLGCALAGYSLSTPGKIVAKLCRTYSGESSIVGGHHEKVPAVFAALINATMAYTLELDDGSTVAKSHPGVVTIPSALAVAEKQGVGGKELLNAITLGYDINIRVGAAIGTKGMLMGFMPETTPGVWGAAAAAGKLLDLDEEQMANAFGILVLCPVAAFEEAMKEGADVENVAPGWGSLTGAFAAMLAERGITGPHGVLEGKRSLPYIMLREKPDFQRTLLNLGSKFEILGSYLKPYACCRVLHAPIDAALFISRGGKFEPEDIRSVTVTTYRYAAEQFAIRNITKSVQARNSIPYAVAVSIVKGKAYLEEFDERGIRDPRVLGLMKKVAVVHTPRMDEMFLEQGKRVAEVKVQLREGKEFSHFVQYPKGEPENPLTDEELETKFRKLAKITLNNSEVDEVLRRVRHLETVDDTADFMELLQQ